MGRSSTQGSTSSQNGNKRKARRSNDHDESGSSDEAPSRSFSQPSSQKAARGLIEGTELRPCVNKVIQVLLLRDTQKLPVPRDKILKILKSKLGDRGTRVAADQVLSAVKDKLKWVFGFELKEGSKSELYSDVQKTQSSQVSQNSTKLYFLVNTLNVPTEGVDDQQDNDDAGDAYEDKAMRTRADLVGFSANKLGPSLGLTLSVLGLVAMEKYKAKEPVLLKAMKDLGLRDDRPHPIHGDANTVLKKLCNMMYLEKRSEKDEDGTDQNFYIPGLRAEKEITRERIVRWIEKVFDCEMTELEREEFLGESPSQA